MPRPIVMSANRMVGSQQSVRHAEAERNRRLVAFATHIIGKQDFECMVLDDIVLVASAAGKTVDFESEQPAKACARLSSSLITPAAPEGREGVSRLVRAVDVLAVRSENFQGPFKSGMQDGGRREIEVMQVQLENAAREIQAILADKETQQQV